MPSRAGLERFVAGVDARHLGRVERDVAAGLGDGGGVVLRADQRRLGPFDLAGQVAHVVGAGVQPGPAGGLGDDGELAVQQLPAGVADHPRPEVLQLAAGRGVERHRLHRAGAGSVVQRAQPATHFAGCALGERHRQHLARGATCPAVTRCAMRRVMVRVLPVPAPASTHTGPRAASTASRCSSSSSSMMRTRRARLDRHGIHHGRATDNADRERVAGLGIFAGSDTLNAL